MDFKTVWISDVHLGSKGCSASELLEFLKTVSYDTLILNGDIIDGWRLKSKWYFPQHHVNVIRKVLSAAKDGKQIIYVTGNHDEFLREYHDYNLEMGNIQIVNKLEYETLGKKFLVVHGDGFDNIVKYHKWIALLGDVGYNLLIGFNRFLNQGRDLLGLKRWSVSKYLKHRVKEAANFIFDFEETAAKAAQRRFDGIICGHIHHPEIKLIGDEKTLYMNSGDWVESCSWLAETHDGKFQIWEWEDGNPVMLAEYNIEGETNAKNN